MVEGRLAPSFLRQYRRTYTQFEDVDDAYASLRERRGHIDIDDERLRFIRQERAHGSLGVLPLHRHFPCWAGATFLEQRASECGHT